MPRITVRFFIDDNEVDRLDADLASDTDAREFIAETKREAATCAQAWVEHPGEDGAEDEAWAEFGRQQQERRGSLAERMRKERERARRLLGEG
jgi:hypothetical protein